MFDQPGPLSKAQQAKCAQMLRTAWRVKLGGYAHQLIRKDGEKYDAHRFTCGDAQAFTVYYSPAGIKLEVNGIERPLAGEHPITVAGSVIWAGRNAFKAALERIPLPPPPSPEMHLRDKVAALEARLAALKQQAAVGGINL